MLIKEFDKKNGLYRVTFRVPCEQLPEDVVASHMHIVASFNNWSVVETPMSIADGIGFETKVTLRPGKYEFRYLINGQTWFNDWEADGYEPNRLQNADNCLLLLEEKTTTKAGKAPKKPGRKKKSKKESAGDDLKKIEGIGPKISSVLQAEGVESFAQLAKLNGAQLKEMLTGKVRISHPDSWPEQAALAAAGDWDGLAKLQDELVGGRRK